MSVSHTSPLIDSWTPESLSEEAKPPTPHPNSETVCLFREIQAELHATGTALGRGGQSPRGNHRAWAISQDSAVHVNFLRLEMSRSFPYGCLLHTELANLGLTCRPQRGPFLQTGQHETEGSSTSPLLANEEARSWLQEASPPSSSAVVKLIEHASLQSMGHKCSNKFWKSRTGRARTMYPSTSSQRICPKGSM